MSVSPVSLAVSNICVHMAEYVFILQYFLLLHMDDIT